MLRHIIAEARKRDIKRLSLETGSWDYFKPAHALYQAHGFVLCAPFEGYVEDRNSLFLTLDLKGG
jgi:putative acetyltransferase